LLYIDIAIILIFALAGFLSTPALASQAALDMLLDNTDGDVGLYFKRINGPVGVFYNADEVFEPASAIKVLIHVHAMLQVQNDPGINLLTLIPWLGDAGKYDGMGNYNPGGNDCYSNNSVDETDTLKQALKYMMENSDNALTQALRDFFGDVNIDATRIALGMNDTLLDHSIGCGGPAVTNHNRLTLVDAGKLHEQVANGLLSPVVRQDFYEVMIDQTPPTNLDAIINEEAAKQGKIQLADDFRNMVSFAYKGGSYGLSDGSYRAIAGWIKIPFSEGNSYREYVFGAFVDGASTLDKQNTGTNLVIGAVASEMLRNLIRGALWTWKPFGLKAPDIGGTIDKLKAFAKDTSPTPLLDQLLAAIASLEKAGRELDKPLPNLPLIMRYIRGAVGNMDFAVANGMLDLEEGHRQGRMIAELARNRAMEAMGLALATGNGRDLADVFTMAEEAVDAGDRFASMPMRAFPGNLYDALDRYDEALILAESTL
jgi:hypothetical protein